MSDRDTDRAAQPPEPDVRAGRRWAFAGGGTFSRLAAALDLVRLRLVLVFEREMEAGRGFLWLPVLFGAGIVAYFGLPREPSIVATGGAALILVLAAWRARTRTALFRVLVVAAAVASWCRSGEAQDRSRGSADADPRDDRKRHGMGGRAKRGEPRRDAAPRPRPGNRRARRGRDAANRALHGALEGARYFGGGWDHRQGAATAAERAGDTGRLRLRLGRVLRRHRRGRLRLWRCQAGRDRSARRSASD